MRGKGTEIVHNIWAAGITPRICGEKTAMCRDFGVSEGSPPHMRGKDRVLCRKGRFLGITPAYAGKSFADHFVRH